MSKITTIVDNIITKVNEHTGYISNLSTNKANIIDVNTANIILKTIATGTATFTATTNNINLTGIGIGVEIGDVIQISGAIDAKNNSEFTVEVITDANNIIVNQAHANKGTTKNVATQIGDAGVTVKLLAKWYNAPIGLGQDWVNVSSIRVAGTVYTNSTKRTIKTKWNVRASAINVPVSYEIKGIPISFVISGYDQILNVEIPFNSTNSTYKLNSTNLSLMQTLELR